VHVGLGKGDRQQIAGLLSRRRESARVPRRALILQQLYQGQRAAQVALNVGMAPKTVRAIARRYEDEGLESALREKRQPGKQPALDARQSQRIIAMVCGPPPEGRARWTVRLIADEAAKRKLAPGVGRETIRILLESHDLKLWRKKLWCVAELDEEYIRRMEELLALHEKPQSEEEPLVCVDEKPVLLHGEVRPPRPMRPGRMLRRDAEYVHRGTANVFCGVEPKAGRHFTRVTSNRSAAQFAAYLVQIVAAYPEADTIHLMVDNLNSHRRKALVDCFGERIGGLLWKRFTVHYTPRHDSWLDQAEIEIGLFSRECLGREESPPWTSSQRRPGPGNES
jgi:transposase